jgi:hypothetical protein
MEQKSPSVITYTSETGTRYKEKKITTLRGKIAGAWLAMKRSDDATVSLE